MATMLKRGHIKTIRPKSGSAAVPDRRTAPSKVVDGIVLTEGLSVDRAIELLAADLAVLRRAQAIIATYASRALTDEDPC